MPDTPVNTIAGTINGDSPTTTDLPPTPDPSPPKGRKTRRTAAPTAETGNGEGAAAGQRTKKSRTPGTAAARSTHRDSAGHRRRQDAHHDAHDDVADRVWGALRAHPAA